MTGSLLTRSVRLGVLIAALVVASTGMAASADPDPNTAKFSTATTQTIFNGGVNTLLHFNIYESPHDVRAGIPPVDQAEPIFLTWIVGLDALQSRVGIDNSIGFIFSTAQTGAVANSGSPIVLNKGVAYYFDTLSLTISVYEPLAGLELQNLDALAAMPEGTVDGISTRGGDLIDPFPGEPVAWAFSTATAEVIIQNGQTFTMHPGNIYCYNRLTDQIILLAETQKFGVRNVDALDAGVRDFIRSTDPVILAPIAFSTDRTQLVRIDGQLMYLSSNSMYQLYPDAVEPGRRGVASSAVLSFDGSARRLRDLDAFTTPTRRFEPVFGACVGESSCDEVTESSCDSEFFFPEAVCDDLTCVCDESRVGCRVSGLCYVVDDGCPPGFVPELCAQP